MEVIPVLVVPLAAFTFLLLIVAGIAQGPGKMESEDAAEYEHFNPRARKLDSKIPEPKHPTDPSETIVKSFRKTAAVSQDPGETTLVGSAMQREPRYCFEYQSVDEVRKIMRERGFSFLVVLDHNMRMVGIVTMENLNRGKKQDPPAPEPRQGGE